MDVRESLEKQLAKADESWAGEEQLPAALRNSCMSEKDGGSHHFGYGTDNISAARYGWKHKGNAP
jgi:hypothetical protein